MPQSHARQGRPFRRVRGQHGRAWAAGLLAGALMMWAVVTPPRAAAQEANLPAVDLPSGQPDAATLVAQLQASQAQLAQLQASQSGQQQADPQGTYAQGGQALGTLPAPGHIVAQEPPGKEGEPLPPGYKTPLEGEYVPAIAGPGPVGCAGCGGPHGHCVPGRFCPCSPCDCPTYCGRLLCHLYYELCCPDPCYEPCFIPVANNAFFVEAIRPVTTTQIRFEGVSDFTRPDRSEFFWARSGGGGKGPPAIETRLDYHQVSLYQEIAAKNASVFFEIPYLTVDPQVNQDNSGFGDMKVGFKSLFFDRDLLQLGFMFTTYLPVGKSGDGLGTGHVSLEPTLLAALKLSPSTYLQGQLSEWIPIGGDDAYQGAVMHWHLALNQVLWNILPDVQLIGSAEFQAYAFQDGAYSDPALGQFQQSSSEIYPYAGAGLRLVICKWLDFGFGAAFALEDHGPNNIYRAQMRVRF